MGTTPQFLLTVVIALSALHMLAPDHWVPITISSYRRRFSRTKTYLLAATIGLGHGVSSSVLSLAIAVVGALFFPVYYVNLFAVLLLIAVAVYIVVKATKESREGTKAESVSMLVSAIPDPALVPFILLAHGFGTLYSSVMVGAFVLAAVVSVTIVVFLASIGLSKALSKVRSEYVDYLVALALILVAVFIYFYG
jgi:hypothetical protein